MDAKKNRGVEGTGLGLSIVKQILKQHNFPFGVQSTKGVGSTFWFEAPISDDTRSMSERAQRVLSSRISTAEASDTGEDKDG